MLILGKSRINTIVIGKIVERSGLHFVCETPDRGAQALKSHSPSIVVLDGGAENADCEFLMSHLEATRRLSGRGVPAVVLLSTGNFHEVSPAHAVIVDAVVSKPILPELLQPVVDRLVRRIRG